MKILLAVDDSLSTQRMLDYLLSHRDWLVDGNRFEVVHGLAPLPHGLAALLTDAEILERERTDARAVLEPVRHRLERAGIAAVFVHAVGVSPEVVARLAHQGGFDLVMLGSHGHGALAQWLSRSTVSGVLARSTVPLLVIR